MEMIKNQTTQPIVQMAVFNNWDVVADGWYFVDSSKTIKRGGVKAYNICGQEVVLWRGHDNKVRATDAYCPHMGTHLGIGKVVNNDLRCFFHHWKFAGDGQCVDVPCQKEIPVNAKLRAYEVVEKYESLWIHPGNPSTSGPEDFDELKGHDLKIKFGDAYTRSCHHHVTMINGIDPQHLKTVHGLDIEMSIDIKESDERQLIDFTLTGKIGDKSSKERIAKAILGQVYSYAMRYDHGNNGLLTLLKNIRLFGSGPKLPTLHMIFAYRPLDKTKTLVQPIYLTKKRKGLAKIWEGVLIWLTQRAFFSLQGEDGKVYENMRFYPSNLLAIDKPVAQYIRYVNRLDSSVWRLM